MRSSRIRVGFHRVGIALAIPLALAGVAVAIVGAYQWGYPLVKPPVWRIEHEATGKSFVFAYEADRKRNAQKMQEVFTPLEVPEDALKAIARVDQERQNGLELVAIGAALLAFAACVYAASWLLGWIIRGFLGEDPI